MELIGLFIHAVVTFFVALGAALLAIAIRPLHRFALAAFLTPPAAVISLILIRWTVIDSAPVCGPDSEWDRCPSPFSQGAGWVAWLLVTIAVALIGYWAQRLFRERGHLFFQSEPTTILNVAPSHKIEVEDRTHSRKPGETWLGKH